MSVPREGETRVAPNPPRETTKTPDIRDIDLGQISTRSRKNLDITGESPRARARARVRLCAWADIRVDLPLAQWRHFFFLPFFIRGTIFKG